MRSHAPANAKSHFPTIATLGSVKQAAQLVSPSRCVHIGDRESDIYELFCAAQELGTHFLVRTCVDRIAGTGKTTISRTMEREPIRGTHDVDVYDEHRRPVKVQVRIRFCRMTVHPPVGKKRRHPPLTLTVLYANEAKKPKGRDPICWKLWTDLPVDDLTAAIEKFDWYTQRWKIETFHKILKSGCKAEESKLRTADRLTNLIAVLCIIAWRVFWLTMVHRTDPRTPAASVFTDREIAILDHLDANESKRPHTSIAHYVAVIAKLGGYLARRSDAPPGNMVLWRGLSRLTDIHLGLEIGTRLMGH